jgi:hypothetical protein
MQSTVILTIGTALSRAEQAGSEVDILVQGTWIHGRVAGLDGHGLVLDDGRGESAVVRLEQVAAVRIDQHGVTEPPVDGARDDRARDDRAGDDRATDGAFPMGAGTGSACPSGTAGDPVPFPRRSQLPELTT